MKGCTTCKPHLAHGVSIATAALTMLVGLKPPPVLMLPDCELAASSLGKPQRRWYTRDAVEAQGLRGDHQPQGRSV